MMKKIAEYEVRKNEISEILELYDMPIKRLPRKATFYSNVEFNPNIDLLIEKTGEQAQSLLLMTGEVVKTASVTYQTHEGKQIEVGYERVPMQVGAIGSFKYKDTETEPVKIEEISLVTPRITILKCAGLMSNTQGLAIIDEEGSDLTKISSAKSDNGTASFFIPAGAEFVKKKEIAPLFKLAFYSNYYLMKLPNSAPLKLSKEQAIIKMADLMVPPLQAEMFCKEAVANAGKEIIAYAKHPQEHPKVTAKMLKEAKLRIEKVAQDLPEEVAQPVVAVLEKLNQYPSINIENLEQLYEELMLLFLDAQSGEIAIEYKKLMPLMEALDSFIKLIKSYVNTSEVMNQGITQEE